MNEQSYSPSFDELAFDRLIDGELSSGEYREFLAGLDGVPDGWRRLALAFLEAQALGAEIGKVREKLDSPAKVVAQPRSVSRWPAAWSLVLAIAGCLLLAVGLGYALRGWVGPNHFGPDRSGGSALVQVHEGDTPQGQRKSAPFEPARKRNGPLGDLTLVVNDGDVPGEVIHVPVFDDSDADERLTFEPSGIPADVRRTLERTGHRVEELRQLVPVSLQDGRQIVLPVEQYRIVPVVRKSY